MRQSEYALTTTYVLNCLLLNLKGIWITLTLTSKKNFLNNHSLYKMMGRFVYAAPLLLSVMVAEITALMPNAFASHGSLMIRLNLRLWISTLCITRNMLSPLWTERCERSGDHLVMTILTIRIRACKRCYAPLGLQSCRMIKRTCSNFEEAFLKNKL